MFDARRAALLTSQPDIAALKPLVWTKQTLQTDLREISDQLKDPDADWKKRVDALTKIVCLALGTTDPPTFIDTISPLRISLMSQIQDLRSQVCKQACHTVKTLAELFGSSFDVVADSLFPHLLPVASQSVAVMSSAAQDCIEGLIAHCEPSRMLPALLDGLKDKRNEKLRVVCMQGLVTVLNNRSTPGVTRAAEQVSNAVKIGLQDANGDVRTGARACFERVGQLWPLTGQKLFDSLDATVIKRYKLLPPTPQMTPRPHSAMPRLPRRTLSVSTPTTSESMASFLDGRAETERGPLLSDAAALDISAKLDISLSAAERTISGLRTPQPRLSQQRTNVRMPQSASTTRIMGRMGPHSASPSVPSRTSSARSQPTSPEPTPGALLPLASSLAPPRIPHSQSLQILSTRTRPAVSPPQSTAVSVPATELSSVLAVTADRRSAQSQSHPTAAGALNAAHSASNSDQVVRSSATTTSAVVASALAPNDIVAQAAASPPTVVPSAALADIVVTLEATPSRDLLSAISALPSLEAFRRLALADSPQWKTFTDNVQEHMKLPHAATLVPKDVCVLFEFLCKELGEHFATLAAVYLPSLLKLVLHSQMDVSAAAHSCMRTIARSPSGLAIFSKLIAVCQAGKTEESAPLQLKCLEYIRMVMEHEHFGGSQLFTNPDDWYAMFERVLQRRMQDNSPAVRHQAFGCVLVFEHQFPELYQKFVAQLKPTVLSGFTRYKEKSAPRDRENKRPTPVKMGRIITSVGTAAVTSTGEQMGTESGGADSVP
eukprot:TRINITY_DN2826_c0_g2_i1.p1 TRINITY_DN2826_c0_g2~~TRINITY_DN2826_c0_g2_i1.p1  ORF type:complete len:775 (-),score=154.48 TRINITY_DN2826_c0_g2_i1:102-2426(-)